MLTRIVWAGLLASALVFAQGGRGGGGGPRTGTGDMGPSSGFGPSTRLDRLTDALKLSKDQKKSIKTVMDDAQKEAVPVHEMITKSRLAIAEAIAAGKGQEEIDKAVHSEAELETQMATIETQALVKMAAVLDAEQKQHQGNTMLFMMVRGAFLGKNWNSE